MQEALFWAELKSIYPAAELNGSLEAASPHIINVYLPGHSAEELLTRLDLAGVAVSAGSACASRTLTPSPVILALGHPLARANSSLRISFGRPTSLKDIDNLLEIFKIVLA